MALRAGTLFIFGKDIGICSKGAKETQGLYSDKDSVLLQFLSDNLRRQFTRSRESCYANGPGKRFVKHLLTFLACARGDARYESALSTSAGGSGPPGVRMCSLGPPS